MSTHNLYFEQNTKDITVFHLKVIIFTYVKVAVYYIGVFTYNIKLSPGNGLQDRAKWLYLIRKRAIECDAKRVCKDEESVKNSKPRDHHQSRYSPSSLALLTPTA